MYLKNLRGNDYLKKYILAWAYMMVIGVAYADVTDMSQDIFQQIIHGSVNTDPNIDDNTADQTVVVSLKSATLFLACTQKNRGDSPAVKSCISKNKPNLLTAGDLSESSFAIGNLAANQQAKIHREVAQKDYYQVINLLMTYANNLQKNMIPSITEITDDKN